MQGAEVGVVTNTSILDIKHNGGDTSQHGCCWYTPSAIERVDRNAGKPGIADMLIIGAGEPVLRCKECGDRDPGKRADNLEGALSLCRSSGMIGNNSHNRAGR